MVFSIGLHNWYRRKYELAQIGFAQVEKLPQFDGAIFHSQAYSRDSRKLT